VLEVDSRWGFEEFLKKPVCPLKPKLPKGPQAQSNNNGVPEGEQSDSSSSSEEEDNG